MSARVVFGLRALLVGVAVALSGCVATPTVRGVLHYGMDDAPEGKRLVWPQPPDVPRFLYTGTLTGEQNFRRPAGEDRALREFGRWLVGLDGKGDASLVLQRPSAVAGDDRGRLYVSDASRQAVFVFDERAGELLVWERAGGLLSFVSPSGLALGTQGELYVADAELGFIVRLDERGAPLGTIGRGELLRPTGLARDPSTGMLYVADTYAHCIKVFDRAGRLVRVVGRRGEGPGEFNFPTHLALVRGELYVTDSLNNRIQVLDPEGGRALRSMGTRGLYVGNLVRPKGVAVDGEGNVYVIESYFDNMLVFSAQGELLLSIGGSGTATGRFFLPAGVWVDANNRVFVADMFNGRIVAFQFLGGE